MTRYYCSGFDIKNAFEHGLGDMFLSELKDRKSIIYIPGGPEKIQKAKDKYVPLFTKYFKNVGIEFETSTIITPCSEEYPDFHIEEGLNLDGISIYPHNNTNDKDYPDTLVVGDDVPPNTGNFVYEELNDVIWKSENDQIVEVNNTGEIKGITSGKVKIYAIDSHYTAKGGRYTAEDGRHIAEKEIEVVAKSNNIFDLEHIIPITILIIIFMTFLNKKLKK